MAISSQAKVSRRGLLTLAATTALAGRVPTPARAQVQPVGEGTVRDHLWVFACPTNSDFPALQRRSVMSPAESAFYLGVPNLIMVQAGTGEAKYGRFEPPFAQYATAVRPLKRFRYVHIGIFRQFIGFSCIFSDVSARYQYPQLNYYRPKYFGLTAVRKTLKFT